MFTVEATVHGQPGQNVLLHVTVVPNIDHVLTIVVNQMTSKLFSVVAPDGTLLGLPGHPALFAMNSVMNLFWLHALESTIAVVKVKCKKRLVSHHVVHIGPHGADGQVVLLHVVVESQQEHVNAMATTNFA